MSREFTFNRLTDPSPGCGYGRYFVWRTKTYGRWFFTETVQAHWSDLPDDPWGEEDKK